MVLFTDEKDTDYDKVFKQASNDLAGDFLFVRARISGGNNEQKLLEYSGVEATD